MLFIEKAPKAKFTHLTILKYHYTKTSLYKLSKNHWFIALFEIFGSVEKKLQFTVFNDHPVFADIGQWGLSKIPSGEAFKVGDEGSNGVEGQAGH